MTITPIRHRDRSTRNAEPTRRPISDDMIAPLSEVPLAEQIRQLQAVLDDPTLSGWHDDARTAMEKLTVVATLAA